jgi:hypothetical protein
MLAVTSPHWTLETPPKCDQRPPGRLIPLSEAFAVILVVPAAALRRRANGVNGLGGILDGLL